MKNGMINKFKSKLKIKITGKNIEYKKISNYENRIARNKIF